MSHEPELLDIAQAAALLRVSRMSLRRWTNAGRLPCFRVGGRRERRFRRVDLLALLEQPQETAAASREPAHLCAMYTSGAARARVAARFLAKGLSVGSTCFLVTAPTDRKGILTRLRALLKRPRDPRSGRLLFSAYRPSADLQLAYWRKQFKKAGRAGVASLRAVGDVSGGTLGRRPFDEVLEYERGYQQLSRRYPVTTLCLYDARRLTGVETSRLLQMHGDLFRQPVPDLVS